MINRTSEAVGGIGSFILGGLLLAMAIQFDALEGWAIVGILFLFGLGTWELSRAFGGKQQEQAEVDDLGERIARLQPSDDPDPDEES